jgi:CspA family cold shock protein
MAAGFVLSFNDSDGYGFIETDEGQKYFVHHRSIEMEGFRTLVAGEQVMFDIATTQRGQEAVHVRKLG